MKKLIIILAAVIVLGVGAATGIAIYNNNQPDAPEVSDTSGDVDTSVPVGPGGSDSGFFGDDDIIE